MRREPSELPGGRPRGFLLGRMVWVLYDARCLEILEVYIMDGYLS